MLYKDKFPLTASTLTADYGVKGSHLVKESLSPVNLLREALGLAPATGNDAVMDTLAEIEAKLQP